MNKALLKNKIAGVLLILIGVLSVFVCDRDATFCVFSGFIGFSLLFVSQPVFNQNE